MYVEKFWVNAIGWAFTQMNITAKKYVIRMHRQPKAAHFDFKGAHILYR